MDQVDYTTLDEAKLAFIAASERTLTFAEKFGFVPTKSLGASANVFSLSIQPFIKAGAGELFVTLIPEGLGTADDARPEDLDDSELTRFWRNIAFKVTSCLTNDAASSGMQTILISLYLPSSTPETVFTRPFREGFLEGFIEACRTVGCVYFSGETPQLRGKIVEHKLDLAGALFGLVPAGLAPITGDSLGAGDRIVLVESSGPHENGFTPLRSLAAKLPNGYRQKLPSGIEYWEAINAPSKLYTPLVQEILRQKITVTSVENITGHGWQKIMRSGKPLRYKIDVVLPVPEIFTFVRDTLKTTDEEMIKVFNYGAGLAVFVKTDADARAVVDIASSQNLQAVAAGTVEAARDRSLTVTPFRAELDASSFTLKK